MGKTHFNDELPFSKTLVDQLYVHWYFPHRLHNIPLFPNEFRDKLKIGPIYVEGGETHS